MTESSFATEIDLHSSLPTICESVRIDLKDEEGSLGEIPIPRPYESVLELVLIATDTFALSEHIRNGHLMVKVDSWDPSAATPRLSVYLRRTA